MASGSNLPIPVQEDGTEQTFQALADQFRLNKEAMDHIKDSKIETLNDLRCFFASEGEVEALLSKSEEISDIELMTSRIRAAWHAIRQQASLRESNKSKIDAADLDDMLDGVQLNDAEQSFWSR